MSSKREIRGEATGGARFLLDGDMASPRRGRRRVKRPSGGYLIIRGKAGGGIPGADADVRSRFLRHLRSDRGPRRRAPHLPDPPLPPHTHPPGERRETAKEEFPVFSNPLSPGGRECGGREGEGGVRGPAARTVVRIEAAWGSAPYARRRVWRDRRRGGSSPGLGSARGSRGSRGSARLTPRPSAPPAGRER